MPLFAAWLTLSGKLRFARFVVKPDGLLERDLLEPTFRGYQFSHEHSISGRRL